MREFPADFLEKCRSVFIDHLGTTLLDIRRKVDQEPEGSTRRDRLSALDSVPRLLRAELHLVPASRAGFQKVFRGRFAEELGISKSRFANIRSSLLSAIKAHAVLTPTLTDRIRPSPAWTTLLAQVDQPDYTSGIRRFACFCTIFNVEPHEVQPGELLLGYYEALCGEGLGISREV